MTNSTFHAGGSRLSPQTVVLHTHCGRKGNKLKRRQEREREARQNESELQKSKVGGKNNLKIAKQAISLILSSSLAYSMLCILHFLVTYISPCLEKKEMKQ